MKVTRLTLILAALLVLALVVLGATKAHGLLTPLAVVGALVALIGGGNLIYGRNSHYAKAQARNRPAQEAHDRAIDEARAAARTAAAARATAPHPQPQPQPQPQNEAPK
jgi:hypothetical protein